MDLTLGIQVTSGGLMVARKGREKSPECFGEQQLTQQENRGLWVAGVHEQGCPGLTEGGWEAPGGKGA